MYQPQHTVKRFTGTKFADKQRTTLEPRRRLLPILKLSPGDEQYFELPEKKSTALYGAIKELSDVENLAVVKPITLEDEEPTPLSVLNNANGTMIYKEKFILRKSTPFREELVMNDLSVSDGKITFVLPSKQVISVKVEDVKFREYEEGTLFDVMCYNGVVQYSTLRNVIPKGVKAKTTVRGELCTPNAKSEWLHHPGRFGATHTAPFAETFEKVARAVDPSLLESHTLFPKGCKFSPVKYRFVVVTRDRARANHRQIGPLGYLVYLGHTREWTREEWEKTLPNESFGTWHEDKDIYVPTYPTNPPEDLERAYIIQQLDTVTLKEAQSILDGTKNRDVNVIGGKTLQERFNCGGKLIVTFKYFQGRQPVEKTVHIASKAWVFREKIMGNNPDLYKHFTSIVTLENFDVNNDDFVEYFKENFSIVKVPGSTASRLGVYQQVLDYDPLDVKEEDTEYFRRLMRIGELPRIMWYNFLCCCNISARKKAFLYYDRYIKELNITAEWLLSGQYKKVTYEKESHKKKVFYMMKVIQRNPDYINVSSRTSIIIYELQRAGEKGANVISHAINYSGNKKKMIMVAEPEAEFYEAPPSYAEMCLNR